MRGCGSVGVERDDVGNVALHECFTPEVTVTIQRADVPDVIRALYKVLPPCGDERGAHLLQIAYDDIFEMEQDCLRLKCARCGRVARVPQLAWY